MSDRQPFWHGLLSSPMTNPGRLMLALLILALAQLLQQLTISGFLDGAPDLRMRLLIRTISFVVGGIIAVCLGKAMNALIAMLGDRRTLSWAKVTELYLITSLPLVAVGVINAYMVWQFGSRFFFPPLQFLGFDKLLCLALFCFFCIEAGKATTSSRQQVMLDNYIFLPGNGRKGE